MDENTPAQPSAPDHETVVITDYPDAEADLRAQCYDIRLKVFCVEQGFSPDLEVDENDARATHLLLRLTPSHTPIGTIRAILSPDATHYIIGRVALLKEYRKSGFGRDLLLAAHAWIVADAKKRGSPVHRTASDSQDSVTVKLGSQIPVMDFYSRYGYKAEGETYLDEGCPHMHMVTSLSLH